MGSKPELSDDGVMVFSPTMKEFRDFEAYVTYMESCGAHKYGIAKVIPPKEWSPKADLSSKDEMVIPSPICQVVTGQGGLFQQFSVAKKDITVKKHRELALSDRYAPPKADTFEELERKYWKNVSFNPPLYGADVPGSLTDSSVKAWNISCLPSILDEIKRSGRAIPGVNTPYLYFGMWKTTFAWHTEDMDLYSINYLHRGASKAWYAIPPDHGKRLESIAKGFFPTSHRECPSFLRHKMTIISPTVLRNHYIPFRRMLQREGEFIITFPFGYHAGFNCGYNVAESTNFALERWIEFGQRATRCLCSSDSVKIDMDIFNTALRRQSAGTGSWVQYAGRMRSGVTRVTDEENQERRERQRSPMPGKKQVAVAASAATTKKASAVKSEVCTAVASPPPSPRKKKRRHSADDAQDSVQKKRVKRDVPAAGILTKPSSTSSVPTCHIARKKKSALKTLLVTAAPADAPTTTGAPASDVMSPTSAPATPALQHHDVADASGARFSFSDNPVDDAVGLWQHQARAPSMEKEWNKFLSQNNSRCAVCSHIALSEQGNGVPAQILKHLKQQSPMPRVATSTSAETTADNTERSDAGLLATRPGLFAAVTASAALTAAAVATSAAATAAVAIDSADPGSDDEDAFETAQSDEGVLSDWSHDSVLGDHNYVRGSIAAAAADGSAQQHQVPRSRHSSSSMSPLRQEGNCQLGAAKATASVQQAAATVVPGDSTTTHSWRCSGAKMPALLTCRKCLVCVHPTCYGIVEPPSSVLAWLCARCEQNVDTTDCCLCAMRGGALKSTDDNRWAHVLCAISIPEVMFGDLETRQPICLGAVPTSRWKLKCHYCQQFGRQQIRGVSIQCSFGRCLRPMHVTCVYRPGVRIVQGDWPQLLRIVCHRHDHAKDGQQRPVDFSIGDQVYAKHKNCRFYEAVVDGIVPQTLYEILFDDNSYSNNMLPEDIVNHDCIEGGPPEKGTVVEVMWTDGQTYGGKFIQSRCHLQYKVKFGDLTIRVLDKDYVYGCHEALPKKVKAKLSISTDENEPQCRETKPVVEGKRNRRPCHRLDG